MDVEIVEGRDPPIVRVRAADTERPALDENAVAQLADELVALGYPEWIRDCARSFADDVANAPALVFELACKHEGTVSAIRKLGAQGAYVECTRCACRIFDEDDDLWVSPPRHGWPRERPDL